MITLEEYKELYPTIRKRVEKIYTRATKISTKGNFFEPISLKLGLEKYLIVLDKVYQSYITAPSFKSKDFTSYVKKITAEIEDYERIATKCESIAEAMKKGGYT
jgi:hypothetical protein